jgi:hypothetical protein
MGQLFLCMLTLGPRRPELVAGLNKVNTGTGKREGGGGNKFCVVHWHCGCVFSWFVRRERSRVHMLTAGERGTRKAGLGFAVCLPSPSLEQRVETGVKLGLVSRAAKCRQYCTVILRG